MKHTALWTILIAILLWACGGVSNPPFTLSSSDDDTKDAGDELVVIVGITPDAAVEASPVDAAADVASPIDASPPADVSPPPPTDGGCTPMQTVSYACYNDNYSLVVPEPTQYCLAQGPLATQTITQLATPPACQCVETFNCACIENSPDFPCTDPQCHEGAGGVLNIWCP